MLLVVLRLIFGVQILDAGIGHLTGGEALFKTIVGGSGTGIGTWVAANSSFMFPIVCFSMILTGFSLILGLFSRLGSFAMLLFAAFFMLGMNSFLGNFSMLGASLAFIIIAPGRYFGLDAYLVDKVPVLRILA